MGNEENAYNGARIHDRRDRFEWFWYLTGKGFNERDSVKYCTTIA
jgi:hypothetical protein